ncbi:DNA-binding protein [Pseudomonas viridiflava]|uniref:DNA-binding protein n=1 Tax=Pseudomonas viridiflava TaxID=33069 RepID=UPI002EB21AC8|nr:DNA-binding protein [Pseudomonas viridiflava]
MERLRTPAEAKLWLQKRGISIQAFALAHNVDAATCYQVLDGRKKGLRGKAHDAAVALGIKEDLSSQSMLPPTSTNNSASPGLHG